MERANSQIIYIELDAILDTRFSTLWAMNPEVAEQLLYQGYHKRMSDNFSLMNPSIDQADFLARYKARNVDLLKESRISNMIYMINKITVDLEIVSLDSPLIDSVEIVINIFPYVFNASEIETLKDMVGTIVGPLTGISVVREPLTALTPVVIKDKYAALILYHGMEWFKNLDPHSIMSKPCPDVRVFIPAIYEDKIPTEDELTDPDIGAIPAFAAFEQEYLTYFSFVFTDIRFFSLVETA